MSAHTPGPWRWELNKMSKGLNLVGGKPEFDLTIISPTRWGMSSATLLIRDTSHEGLNILHKLHERDDWIAAFPKREHHERWCASVIHPDMKLMEAAPDMLAALEAVLADVQDIDNDHALSPHVGRQVRAAILKAKGEPS